MSDQLPLIEIDGRAMRSVTSRGQTLIRDGLISSGERRWADDASARALRVAGWQYLGTAEDGTRLLWLPIPAEPADGR